MSITGSTGATGGSITNLCPGNYSLTITDSQNCSVNTVYTIGELTIITASTTATDNKCFGYCNGSILLSNVAGGAPPYTYQWSDPAGQTSLLASGLCTGNYFALITDVNGCSDTIRAAVASPSLIAANPTITQPSCGACNGQAILSPVGGNGGYSYIWSNGSVTDTASNLCSGVYMVTISDSVGCQNTVNVVINNSSGFSSIDVTVTDETCAALAMAQPLCRRWVARRQLLIPG